MTMPVITALYAAVNATFNIALALRVSLMRFRHRVSLGDPKERGSKESKELFVAIRTHGNNAEFVPLAMLLLLVAELCGGSSNALHAYGGAVFVSRVLHAIGLPRKSPNFYRATGSALMWIGIVAISGYLLVLRTKR